MAEPTYFRPWPELLTDWNGQEPKFVAGPCPMCGGELEKVIHSFRDIPMSIDQFDSIKAGDYYCTVCPERSEPVRQAETKYRYFSDHEIDIGGLDPNDSYVQLLLTRWLASKAIEYECRHLGPNALTRTVETFLDNSVPGPTWRRQWTGYDYWELIIQNRASYFVPRCSGDVPDCVYVIPGLTKNEPLANLLLAVEHFRQIELDKKTTKP